MSGVTADGQTSGRADGPYSGRRKLRWITKDIKTQSQIAPKVVSQEEWKAASEKLLAKKKQLMRQHDQLAAERRWLSVVKIEKRYVFEGPAGEAGLLDLFEGGRQLADGVEPALVFLSPQRLQRRFRRRHDEY